MNVYEETYLPDMLHGISQGLLVPTMILIIALIVVTIFLLGRSIVEFFCERRYYKQNMPAIVNDVNDADYSNLTDVVVESKLLEFQKAALVTVTKNMGLSEESLFALAQIEINTMERRYQRRLGWTDTISKIAPLLGLMGTLIPLGPGIVALGTGDVQGLSNSLLLAFDATVCGLVCAIIALIISRVRGSWYGEYVSSLESIMSCVVDRADQARKAGLKLPANYTGDPLKEFQTLQDETAGKKGKSLLKRMKSENGKAAVEAEAAAGAATKAALESAAASEPEPAEFATDIESEPEPEPVDKAAKGEE